MWVCTGPFDGATSGAVNFQKSKLLKPGSSYTLGRKRCALVVNHKNIHSEHLLFTVGEYTEDDASNPEAVPQLEVRNMGNKSRRIKRGEVELLVDPGASVRLQGGDVFYILNDVFISLRRENVCCFSSLPPSEFRAPTKDCAKLGVSILVTPHPGVTHHLTPSFSLEATIAGSLLSLAHFVKPDWLTTLLSLGEATNGPSSLESSFALPRIADFRPDYSSTVPSTLKTLRTWEPNEARVDMLRPYRVIFVGEKGREARSDEKDLVKRGGGEYECCSVSSGKDAFRNVLAKGSAKGKDLVLAADEHAMGAAIGQDTWMGFVDEAARYRLKFIRPEKLVHAVIQIDASLVDCKLSSSEIDNHRFSTPLPEVVPNTHSDEPSHPQSDIPAPQRRKLLRRHAAPAVADPPITPAVPATESSLIHPPLPTEGGVPEKPSDGAEKEPERPPPSRRKNLTRRHATPTPGTNDPTGNIATETHQTSAPSQFVAPTPVRSRLKRRRDGDVPKFSFNLDPLAPEQDQDEPAHKKYKSLFEQSDPDLIAQSGLEEYRTMFSEKQSVTQSEALHGRSAARSAALHVVPEEEEESAGVSLVAPRSLATEASSRPAKRKATDEDAEIADTNHARRRQRTDEPSEPLVALNGVASTSTAPDKKPQAKSKVTVAKAEKSGASEGKVDKDDAFLKAVASTKRGKKKEDNFDREFNNLRISKPDLSKDESAKEWAVLEEFGDDTDLRGNFMVVVEMEVFRKVPRGGANVLRREGGRLDWDGRADFKKFKKKTVVDRRPPVELVVEDEGDLTISSRLLGDGRALSRDMQTNPRRRGREPDDSDDDGLPSLANRRTIKTASNVVPPLNQAAPSRTTSSKSSQRKDETPLFIESDDEGPQPEQRRGPSASSSSKTQTQVASSEEVRRPPARAARRKPTKAISDSEDDELAFKGFAGRRRR